MLRQGIAEYGLNRALLTMTGKHGIRASSSKVTCCGLIAVSLIANSACTSVHWRGNDGLDHHLGLFTYVVAMHSQGTELRRTSVGVNLRLSGQNRGISVGVETINEIKPTVVVAKGSVDLDQQAIQRITSPDCPAASTRRGFWYLSEDITRDVTVLDSSVYGIDASSVASNSSFTIGYSHSFNYVGDALGEDIVQVYQRQPNDADHANLTLIKLQPLARSLP